ncbi:MAG: GNAT superfamily N-acetyltransferase [Verrucomicrobiales bacterium]|jgi:GNAT superfamily N-acetyltransferase
MSASEVERIIGFEHRFARAQATTNLDLSYGFAVLQADFPNSHYHNRLVVTSPASPADILAATEEILRNAGSKHRYVTIDDDALGDASSSDFVAAGYEHETIATMIHRGPEPTPPRHDVQAVSLDTLRPALLRDWRIELPSASADEIDQLAGRTALYSHGADVTLLAVFDRDEIVARAELYVDHVERIAQFENLFTHPDFRGRGYGDSLLREALRRGRQAGCELSCLTADLGDWPVEWYSRFGYEEICRSHHFDRPGFTR